MKDRAVWFTTFGDIVDFMDQEKERGVKEPQTPEEWTSFMVRLHEAKKAEFLGTTTASTERLGDMMDQHHIDVKIIRPDEGHEK